MLVMAFPPKPVGGAELQCLKLSRQLVQRGRTVFVLTEGGPGLKRFEQIDGVRIHRLFWGPGGWILHAMDVGARLAGRRSSPVPRADGLPYNPDDAGIQFRNKWREAVRYLLFLVYALPVLFRLRKDLDVLHVHIVPWMSYVGSLLGALFRFPVVVKESTVTGVATVRTLPCGQSMVQSVRKRCWFIAMTGAIRQALLSEGISEARIEMIPNGVDPVQSARMERIPRTCLTVGNLTQGAAKGFDILFRSWVEVLRRSADAQLWVAGGGEPAGFSPFLDSLGIGSSVKFLGPVDYVQQLYLTAAVVALPSRREGMSNALLEAMAAGAPIVATRVSGAEDLIQNGSNGQIVEVGDVTGLAEGILGFFADPAMAARCGENAKATVLETCGMSTVVDSHLALYERLGRHHREVASMRRA